MLYGNTSNAEWFANKALREAVAFLRDKAPAAADGRYELSDGAYVMIKAFSPQPREQRRYETHVKFADIQCVLEGDETICVRPPEGLRVEEEHLAERDIAYYHQPGDGAPEQDFVMRPGFFLLLCPEDAHKPECLTTVAQGRKAVVKIPMTSLT